MLLNYYTAFLEKHMQGRLGSLIRESGDTVYFSTLAYQSEAALLPMLTHQTGEIILGSDNSAETGDSYFLKKAITSGINVAVTRSVVDNDDGSHSSVVVANITNISSAPITVGEIGLRKIVATGNTTTYFLIDRTPLGTPLTIQPGEVGRIVYTITMS
jgi:hypothetical protein